MFIRIRNGVCFINSTAILQKKNVTTCFIIYSMYFEIWIKKKATDYQWLVKINTVE